MMSKSFNDLCDNTLVQVLSFADFKSAVKLSKMASASLSVRCANFDHIIWRQIFERHLFRGNLPEGGADPVKEISKRRQYFDSLVGKKNRRSCFNLPNRYFYFVPVLPNFENENENENENEDADSIVPSVDFDCPSFVLTTSSSGEMAFLDPFDGSLVVQKCCTDNAVASDEAMMYSAMTDAADIINHKSSLGLSDVPEQDIAGAIIEQSVFRNHNMEHFKVAPSRVLLDIHDYFSLQLDHYFLRGSMSDDDEIEMDVGVGIESKLTPSGDTMIAVGRTLANDSTGWREPLIVTEMIAFLLGQEKRLVCRFRSGFACMDIDPIFNRLFVAFPLGEGPFAQMDAAVHPDERFDMVYGGRIVAAYPFEEWEKDEPPEISHFPRPLFCLQCRHAVSSITIMGDKVLAATISGTIEIWKTLQDPGTVRIGILDIRKRLRRAEFRLRDDQAEPDLVSEGEMKPTATETDSMNSTPLASQHIHGGSVRVVEDDQQELEAADEDGAADFDYTVNSFHGPSHLSIEDSGFVSLHHHHGRSSSLLLWKVMDGAFEIVSSIKLPISSRRKPRIHYDGRRLVVFGQDHIGMILLVYHVLSTWEDVDDFSGRSSRKNISGGAENYTSMPFVRFVNIIRHAGLGGLEYYDSAYMTCNERFIVVNTKTGNLLGGGATATTDGLLVIDLEDYQ